MYTTIISRAKNHWQLLLFGFIVAVLTLSIYQNASKTYIDDLFFYHTNSHLTAGGFVLSNKPGCSNISVKLVGEVPIDRKKHPWRDIQLKFVNTAVDPNSSFTQPYETIRRNIQQNNTQKSVKIWKPYRCATNMSTAIIIPYRNRDEHLRLLLNHLHLFLRHQLLSYTIFVIDQAGETTFNRGTLLNIGFLEASVFPEFYCFILHDVDKLPENDHILYSCTDKPTLLSSALSEFGYNLLYSNFFGGVVAITREQFVKTNGFSNMYYGWGGEDDDFLMRLSKAGYVPNRLPTAVGRYLMLPHDSDKHNSKNPNRHNLLKTASNRIYSDGLNTTKYNVLNYETLFGGLIQWISVSIPPALA